MSSRRGGMTVIEVVISVLIGLTVMGTAFTIYQSSTQLGRKASGISASSAAAARFFYALEMDVANLRAQQNPESTFNTTDSDVVGTGGGTRLLYFTRRRPEKQFNIDFDSWDYTDKDDNGVEVSYEAKIDPTKKLYDLKRYLGPPEAPIQETDFFGIYAKDIRFSRVRLYTNTATGPPPPGTTPEPDSGESFLRVSLVLVSEVDPEKVSSANATKPVMLSTLYHIPNLGASVDKDRLDKNDQP